MRAEIERQHPWDCYGLAARMRLADRNEVKASGGYTPLEALLVSHKASEPDLMWTAHIEGSPHVMWGCADAEPGCPGMVGVPWLLGSDSIGDIKRQFVEVSVQHIALMHERYPVLTNWVHLDNHASARWLSRLGFQPVDFDEHFGVGKQPFIRYQSCASQ